MLRTAAFCVDIPHAFGLASRATGNASGTSEGAESARRPILRAPPRPLRWFRPSEEPSEGPRAMVSTIRKASSSSLAMVPTMAAPPPEPSRDGFDHPKGPREVPRDGFDHGDPASRALTRWFRPSDQASNRLRRWFRPFDPAAEGRARWFPPSRSPTRAAARWFHVCRAVVTRSASMVSSIRAPRVKLHATVRTLGGTLFHVCDDRA